MLYGWTSMIDQSKTLDAFASKQR